MKALKIIGGIVLGIVVIFVIIFFVVVSGSPAEGSMHETMIVNAPIESVYEEVVNIKKLDAWSPWRKMDPEAYSYEGPEEGVGAMSKWDSQNPNLRKGSVEIVEATPNKGIRTKMIFDGVSGNFSSWVDLESQNEQTKITWGYSFSELGMMWRFLFGLGDQEADMRPLFVEGLNDLKAIVEAKPVPVPLPEVIEVSSDSTEVAE